MHTYIDTRPASIGAWCMKNLVVSQALTIQKIELANKRAVMLKRVESVLVKTSKKSWNVFSLAATPEAAVKQVTPKRMDGIQKRTPPPSEKDRTKDFTYTHPTPEPPTVSLAPFSPFRFSDRLYLAQALNSFSIVLEGNELGIFLHWPAQQPGSQSWTTRPRSQLFPYNEVSRRWSSAPRSFWWSCDGRMEG